MIAHAICTCKREVSRNLDLTLNTFFDCIGYSNKDLLPRHNRIHVVGPRKQRLGDGELTERRAPPRPLPRRPRIGSRYQRKKRASPKALLSAIPMDTICF